LKKHISHIFCLAFFIGILFQSNKIFGQKNEPSAAMQISLLTSSPGDELYTTFGHSAVRIKDTLAGYDLVYNYGIFDFRTPNFYQKFIQGKLLYRLGKQRINSFLEVYTRENRLVSERVMNLNEAQKVKVVNFLNENYKPENRKYLYDFFYDNCATRIRDLVETEFEASFNYTNETEKDVTFRQLLDEYLVKMPWADFGIDLILGVKADAKANFRNQMFLPDYLESNLAEGALVGKPLFQESKVLLPYQFELNNTTSFVSPLLVFSLLFFCFFLFTFFIKNNTVQKIIDWILFIILGVAGCVFLFMWLGTDHQACYQN